MRIFLLAFGGLELALLAFGVVKVALTGFRGDAAGQGLAMAFAVGGGVVSLLLLSTRSRSRCACPAFSWFLRTGSPLRGDPRGLVPMLAMTWRGRSPWRCLLLALLAVIRVRMVVVAE